MNNNGTDQTVQMLRLVCALVVCKFLNVQAHILCQRSEPQKICLLIFMLMIPFCGISYKSTLFDIVPFGSAWVKVFRAIPDFRILKVGLKMLNVADCNSFSE